MKPKKKPARFVVNGGVVWDDTTGWQVVVFTGEHPHPRTAARAEARRLNAWWERKRRVKR